VARHQQHTITNDTRVRTTMIGRYTLLTGVAALFMAIETAHAAEVNWPPWLHDVLDTIVQVLFWLSR
jgi:uncharacterized membrane protein HdeD (DUF308 family)